MVTEGSACTGCITSCKSSSWGTNDSRRMGSVASTFWFSLTPPASPDMVVISLEAALIVSPSQSSSTNSGILGGTPLLLQRCHHSTNNKQWIISSWPDRIHNKPGPHVEIYAESIVVCTSPKNIWRHRSTKRKHFILTLQNLQQTRFSRTILRWKHSGWCENYHTSDVTDSSWRHRILCVPSKNAKNHKAQWTFNLIPHSTTPPAKQPWPQHCMEWPKMMIHGLDICDLFMDVSFPTLFPLLDDHTSPDVHLSTHIEWDWCQHITNTIA